MSKSYQLQDKLEHQEAMVEKYAVKHVELKAVGDYIGLFKLPLILAPIGGITMTICMSICVKLACYG